MYVCIYLFCNFSYTVYQNRRFVILFKYKLLFNCVAYNKKINYCHIPNVATYFSYIYIYTHTHNILTAII